MSRIGCPKFRHGWNSGAGPRALRVDSTRPASDLFPRLLEDVRVFRKCSAGGRNTSLGGARRTRRFADRTKLVPLPAHPDNRYHRTQQRSSGELKMKRQKKFYAWGYADEDLTPEEIKPWEADIARRYGISSFDITPPPKADEIT